MDSLPFLHLDMQSLLVIRGEMYAWSGQMCLWCVGVKGFIGHFMDAPRPIPMKSAKHDVVNALQHQLYWIMQIQVLHVLRHSQSCWTFFHKCCWYHIVKHQLDLQNQNTIPSPLNALESWKCCASRTKGGSGSTWFKMTRLLKRSGNRAMGSSLMKDFKA